jgi:hypothetical protein
MAKPVRAATARKKKKVVLAPATPLGTCFVISPFGGYFNSYHTAIFEPAIEAAKLKPCRADDLYRPSSIIHDIWNYVSGATVLLADLTGKNPNVLYELGLAHAIGKPVVMVTQVLDDVPFDLRNLRVITYDLRDPAWAKLLGDSITHALEEVLVAPESAVPPVFLRERKESKSPQVSPMEKKLLELTQQVESLRRSQRRLSSDDEVMLEGPDEARALIRRYVSMGMPSRMIIDRVARRGPPVGWVRDELRKFKLEADPGHVDSQSNSDVLAS